VPLARPCSGGAGHKSLFASFSSEKEESATLYLEAMALI
jgi:hypothetical protein